MFLSSLPGNISTPSLNSIIVGEPIFEKLIDEKHAFQIEVFEKFASFLSRLFKKQIISDSPVLIIKLQDGSQKKILRFKESVISIGRSILSEIELADRYVSREHVKIFKKHNQYYLTDRGSTNGTYLNKKFLEYHKEYLLTTGDSIQIERFKMFVAIETPQRKSPAQFFVHPLSLLRVSSEYFMKIRSAPSSVLVNFQFLHSSESIYIDFDLALVKQMLAQYQGFSDNFHSDDDRQLNTFQRQDFENILIELENFFNRNYGKERYSIKFVDFIGKVKTSANHPLVVLRLKTALQTTSGLVQLAFPERYKNILSAYLDKNCKSSSKNSPKALVESNQISQVENRKLYAASAPGSDSQNVQLRQKLKNEKFARIENFCTRLYIELGTFSISSYEMMLLEINDILLLKNSNLQYIDGKLSGEVQLKVKSGSDYFWLGELKLRNQSPSINIHKIVKNIPVEAEPVGRLVAVNRDEKHVELGSQPFENFLTKREIRNPAQRHDSIHRREILEGINILLSLEFKPIQITIAEIMKFKPGYILLTEPSIFNTVSLVADTKILAHGCLTEHSDACAFQIQEILV